MIKFGSVTVAFNEEDLIGPCLELLDVEKKIVVISNKTFQGNVLPRDKTEKIALKKGAIVIRVDISDQYEMRNIGLSLLEGMGIDYSLLVDADEWFSYEAMRNFKERVKKTKKDGYRVKLVHLIKKPNYQAIPTRDGGTLECIKSDKRLETRDPHWWHNYYNYDVNKFPEGLGEVYHLSWVRRPEKIKEKIENFSHAGEMRKDWFKKVWQKFSPDMKNFGPTRPTDFEKCKVIELPQEIKERIPKHLW